MICMFPVVRARGVHGSGVGWGGVGMKRIECRVVKTKRFAILVQIRLGTLCQTRTVRASPRTSVPIVWVRPSSSLLNVYLPLIPEPGSVEISVPSLYFGVVSTAGNLLDGLPTKQKAENAELVRKLEVGTCALILRVDGVQFITTQYAKSSILRCWRKWKTLQPPALWSGDLYVVQIRLKFKWREVHKRRRKCTRNHSLGMLPVNVRTGHRRTYAFRE